MRDDDPISKTSVSLRESLKWRFKETAATRRMHERQALEEALERWIDTVDTPPTHTPDSTGEHASPLPFATELDALNMILSGRDVSAKRAVRALLQEFTRESTQAARPTGTNIAEAIRAAERVAAEARRAAQAGRETGETDDERDDARRGSRARKA